MNILVGDLVKGRIYTVRDYVSSHYGTDEPCIRLVEVIRVTDLHGFRASRFRPVSERNTDISIFTKMLTSAQKTERVRS